MIELKRFIEDIQDKPVQREPFPRVVFPLHDEWSFHI